MLIMLIMLLVMVIPVMVSIPFARTALKSRKDAKAIESKYDADGFLTTYDPHYTRAREIELGTHEGLLTTCDDKGCETCSGTRRHIDVPELMVNAPELEHTYNPEAEEGAAKALAEAQAESERIERETEYERQFLIDHPVSEFRPATVPDRAYHIIIEGTDPTIVWSWDDLTYSRVLKGYVLHNEENNGITNTTIRKRRYTLEDLIDMVEEELISNRKFLTMAEQLPGVEVEYDNGEGTVRHNGQTYKTIYDEHLFNQRMQYYYGYNKY